MTKKTFSRKSKIFCPSQLKFVIFIAKQPKLRETKFTKKKSRLVAGVPMKKDFVSSSAQILH
jgi:hypothetical protein